MRTLEDLREAYPKALHAVCFCEGVYEERSWRVIRRLPADRALAEMRRFAEEIRDSGEPGKWVEVIAEMDEPQFLNYFKAKTGAV
jgi:hypothetical protein